MAEASQTQIFHDHPDDRPPRVKWYASRIAIYGILIFWTIICLFPIYWTIDMQYRSFEVLHFCARIGPNMVPVRGEDTTTRDLEALMGDGLYGRFYGAPAKVCEGFEWLASLGVSRCQISPVDDASIDRLAPLIHA